MSYNINNRIPPLSMILLKMVKRRKESYAVLQQFILTLPKFEDRDSFTHMRKVQRVGKIRDFFSHFSGEVVVEKKIDGISCLLTYRRGRLLKGVTKRGLNVTRLVRRIDAIPKETDGSFTGEIRGELYLPKSQFIQSNRGRRALGLHAHKTHLSALVALMNSNHNMYRDKIRFQGFLINTTPLPKTQIEVLKKIKSLGINRNLKNFQRTFVIPRDKKDLYEYIRDKRNRKEEFAAEIDGLVIKANALAPQRIERKIIAFKYYY
jgi:DNA ligase (NAD+)